MKEPVGSLSLSSVLPDDEEDWIIGDLVAVGAGKRVGVKRRLQDLQESCRIKKRKVPGSVSVAVGLAGELVDEALVATLPGQARAISHVSTSWRKSC